MSGVLRLSVIWSETPTIVLSKAILERDTLRDFQDYT